MPPRYFRRERLAPPTRGEVVPQPPAHEELAGCVAEFIRPRCAEREIYISVRRGGGDEEAEGAVGDLELMFVPVAGGSLPERSEFCLLANFMFGG